MTYTINILQERIRVLQIENERLEQLEPEMNSDLFTVECHIKNNNEYLEQMQKAIKILSEY